MCNVLCAYLQMHNYSEAVKTMTHKSDSVSGGEFLSVNNAFSETGYPAFYR